MPDSETILIKSFTDRLVKKAGGTKAAANFCDTSPAMISNYCTPNNNHTITAKSLIALTNVTQDASLLNHIMSLCKFQQVDNQVVNASEILKTLAMFNKEGAELGSVSLEAIADNRLTKTESLRIVQEAMDVVDALTKLIRQVSSAWDEEATQSKESSNGEN